MRSHMHVRLFMLCALPAIARARFKGNMPGVLAHAQALRTALHGRPVQAAHPAGIVIVLSVVALLLAIRNWRLALVAGALASAGILAGAVWMLREGVHVIRTPRHMGLLSPIVYAIPVQLLAYHTALRRGTDVDKPRNLVKSVTVE